MMTRPLPQHPSKYVDKAENKLHTRNFDSIHQTFVEIAIKHNKQIEANLGFKLHNYDQLHGSITQKTEDGRTLNVRYAKIPMLTSENRPQYFLAVFVNIDYYDISDIRQLHAFCINHIDQKDVDSYRIYLAGKQIGRTPQLTWNTLCHKYQIWKINTNTISKKHREPSEVRARIYHGMSHFLDRLTNGLKDKLSSKYYYYQGKRHHMTLFGNLLRDFERLAELATAFYRMSSKWLERAIMTLAEKKTRETLRKEAIEKRFSYNIKKQVSQVMKLNENVKKAIESQKTRRIIDPGG